MIEAGLHGLVTRGTTGEFMAITLEERKNGLELVIKFTAGRVPVVAGIGALSTLECVDFATHAAKAGADALIGVPPFYDLFDYQQLRTLMEEVHKASNLPIMFYNIPSASGITLSPTELASLSEVSVQCMKDRPGNAPALTDLLFGLDERIMAFNG